jgi:tRNA A-37 threonylcarbamoyl transferase component Bud32
VPADLLEGRNLGKYRVLEPLGRGGMARVYRAYHPQLDRYVAIKVLRSDLVEEEEFLDRFKREAQAVAALRHPNIVQVFDFDVQDETYYMVMELLQADSLRTRLNDFRARGERMPLGEVTRILLDLLSGLAYAHSEQMIHRDVKPANILLSSRGQAVLGDFGIAQIVGGTRYTIAGALMGTLNYMSPEQGLEGQCDARSDLYSVGIVFYEMLTGDPPFDAETPLAILMKHVNDPLRPPRKVEPSIPKPYERVVLKSLAKRPDHRYQTAEEMAEALQKAASKARVRVAERLSPPVSFTTREAPSEPVVVLSGTARGRVEDAGFAGEDTDGNLGQRLAAEAAARSDAEAGEVLGVGVPAAGADTPDAAAGGPDPWPKVPLLSGADAVSRDVREPVPPKALQAPVPETTQPGVAKRERSRSKAILNAVGLVAITNLVVVFFGLVTRWWGVFRRGWPFEVLLAGLALCAIMEATGNVWLLIPTGLLLGNGLLLSFYALTGAWRLWIVLWPLEPLLIVGVVLITVRLSQEPERAEQVIRRFAQVVRRPALVVMVLVVVLGAIFG